MNNKKILVTGGTGMVGQAFIAYPNNCILAGSKECNLLDYHEVVKLIARHQPDIIVHLAAKVGGVKGNMNDQYSYFNENLNMNTNVLKAAHDLNVDMVVSMLSTCIYPKDQNLIPYTENNLHTGVPHESNFGYAYAKRMLEVQSRIYREQFGRKYICVIPNNIFGPNDNFDLENGHVLPAIIRKIYEAKITNKQPIFWGNGSSLRQFTYSKDVAKSIMRVIDVVLNASDKNKLSGKDLIEQYCLINIGTNEEVSIRDVVNIVCDIYEYDKALVCWDETKPSGIHRKPSTNDVFMNFYLKDQEQEKWYTDLHASLKETCEWFINNYPTNIRGIKPNEI